MRDVNVLCNCTIHILDYYSLAEGARAYQSGNQAAVRVTEGGQGIPQTRKALGTQQQKCRW